MLIDIKKTLDEFSKETKEKKYNRINYDIWCNLNKIDDCHLSFILKSAKKIAKIQGAGKTYEFNYNDTSFGRFLYDKYWNKAVINDIYTNITTAKEINSDMATSSRITLNNSDNSIYTKGDNSIYTKGDNYINTGVYLTDLNMPTSSNVTTSNSVYITKIDDCATKYDYPINDDGNAKKEKENKNMFNKFDFGPVTNNSVRFSPYGLSIRNLDNKWVSYNIQQNQIIETDGFTFEMENMIYKIPVAIKDIRPGDMIIHNGDYVYVLENMNGNIKVVNIFAGDQRVILPLSNMFGFNFVIKVVSILDMTSFGCGTPTADQPFGNILPMLIMSQMFGDKSKNKNNDFGQIMMMSMLFNNQNPFANMFTNTLQPHHLTVSNDMPPVTPCGACGCATSGTTLNPANAPTI